MMLCREEPRAEGVSSLDKYVGETWHTYPAEAPFWLDVQKSFGPNLVHDADCRSRGDFECEKAHQNQTIGSLMEVSMESHKGGDVHE
jgi:hypothetical protein